MILSALNNYYQRLAERQEEGVAPYGYSQEKISYAIVLSESGQAVGVIDLCDYSGRQRVERLLQVPSSFKRPGTGSKPFFLWDKTSYVLGVGKRSDRTEQDHAAFKELHMKALANEGDPGLQALLRFLSDWRAERFYEDSIFVEHGEKILDTNIVFKLDGELVFLHERPAAKVSRLRLIDSGDEGRNGRCLVVGEVLPLARLHPSIKGFESTGSSVVSFNDDAYLSYGGSLKKLRSKNKENDCSAIAPVSETAAFAYTTVLNHLLRKGSRQRLQLGDTTVVFWAEAGSAGKAKAAEGLFAELLDPPATDASETDKLRPALEAVAKGRPLRELNPELEDETRVYVLGLAPNKARLSIRFFETGSLRAFAERLAQHYRDLELQPLPWRTEPSVWRLLLQTVPHREGNQPKPEDIAPQLAGEMTRAILSGRRYPGSLLSNLIMRMRADGNVSPLRVALCKAVLARDARIANKVKEKETPMSLDTENAEPGYLLGRLFAALENVQHSALGDKVNATIRDRYYGAASATPAIVFPVLVRNAQHHLSRLRKDKPGAAVNLEKQINEIVDKLPPSFPKSLRIEAQGRFAIGYYHQNKARFGGQESNTEEGEE